MLRPRSLTIVLVVVSALVAGATSALASTHARAAKAKYPPCTKAALKAGIHRGPATFPARFTKPFGCARRWAYSGGLAGHGRSEVEVTILYHAVHGRWQTSRRLGPCRAHAVPKKIYRPACETN